HLINTTLDVVKLPHELLFLPFNAHWYLFKLAVSDDDRIVIPRGDPAAELFSVSRFKILLGGHEDIGTRIQPQILRRPLPDKMIWHDKHGLLAKPKPLAFLCGGYHLKGFPCAHLMGKECVPAIEDMGDRIDLMGSQRDFRADAAKHDVAPVILTGAGIVKGVIVITGQAVPALRVCPYP